MRKIFVRQYCPFPAMRGLSIGYLIPHPSPLAPPEPVIHGSGFLTWQIDGEARPLPGLRGDIYGSVMAVNDGSGEHEADARTPFTLGGKKPLEQSGFRPFVHSATRIRHLIAYTPVFCLSLIHI